MPISRERFEQGITPQQFIDQMSKNRERFEANLAANETLFNAEDDAVFSRRPLYIAALGEDWCTDVIQFFPVVFKLAERYPTVTVKVFLRDQNLDIMDQYLNQGQYRSIPTFILYDEAWNELGHFIERPASQTEEMAQETRRFAQANPHLVGINRAYENMPDETRSLVRENNQRYRWERMLDWNRRFLDEFREIAARAAVSSKS